MILNANSASIPLADKSVHMAVTSPPYWGLRKYDGDQGIEWPAVTYTPMPNLPPVTVPGCDPECEHVWGEDLPAPGQKAGYSPDKPSGFQQKSQAGQTGALSQMSKSEASGGSWRQRCGGWRGELGLEPTPELFVAHIVAVFREVWRVLRDDGVLFLNLGDSYASNGGSRNYGSYDGNVGRGPGVDGNRTPVDSLKPKDLCGIPWRVAFALQADGWYLRSDIIWAKGLSFCDEYAGSCMPESVRDRPTKAHENVFLLAKNERYYYDAEAVKEATVRGAAGSTFNGGKTAFHQLGRASNKPRQEQSTRNLRDVWAINPAGYRGAHFATFPPDLVAPCILAGTSLRGACPECGAPWERVVEKELIDTEGWGVQEKDHTGNLLGAQSMIRDGKGWAGDSISKTTGWRPTCDHDADPVPATVLDPFCGSGTVGEVCRETGRRFVGLDLSETYLRDLALPRAELKQTIQAVSSLPLFGDNLAKE